MIGCSSVNILFVQLDLIISQSLVCSCHEHFFINSVRQFLAVLSKAAHSHEFGYILRSTKHVVLVLVLIKQINCLYSVSVDYLKHEIRLGWRTVSEDKSPVVL